jgi:predicted amidophosphoribosyltransferase
MGERACYRAVCPNCGLQLSIADETCPECGADIDAGE